MRICSDEDEKGEGETRKHSKIKARYAFVRGMAV